MTTVFGPCKNNDLGHSPVPVYVRTWRNLFLKRYRIICWYCTDLEVNEISLFREWWIKITATTPGIATGIMSRRL